MKSSIRIDTASAKIRTEDFGGENSEDLPLPGFNNTGIYSVENKVRLIIIQNGKICTNPSILLLYLIA
jgi:hypothetical protein